MTVFVALLRAVNLGGESTLSMADLKKWTAMAGFRNPRTYIASGNLLLESDLGPDAVKAGIERMLKDRTGRNVSVIVRTAKELAEVVAANPFVDKPANRTVAIFLDEAPPRTIAFSGAVREEVAGGVREIYVSYPDGQGRSKLKAPAAGHGTARNMNTVAKLADLAAAP